MTYIKILEFHLLPIKFHLMILILLCPLLTDSALLKPNQYHSRIINFISFYGNLNRGVYSYLYIAYFGQIHILSAEHLEFAFFLHFLHLRFTNIQK